MLFWKSKRKKGPLMVMKTMIAVRSVTKVVVNIMISEYKFSGGEHLFKNWLRLQKIIRFFNTNFK